MPATTPIPQATEEFARQIVDATYTVHRALGPGLLESVYETCLAHELTKRRLQVARQIELPIVYDSLRLDAGLRLDLLVENTVVIELKAVEKLLPIHTAQALTYLKLTGLRLALLINFNVAVISDGIRRVVR
jgi:GxxExxY protein